MRCFVAIALPDIVAASLEPVQEALPVGRPADPEQFHLTLAFLGDQPDDLVDEAHHALEDITATPFEMQLAGLETFESKDGIVLWSGPRDPAPIKALAAKIRSALHGAGLPLERRRFRPHVTLARLNAGEAAEDLKLARFLARWSAFPSPAFTVSSFGLYQSTLTRDGAIHEELARYPLDRRGSEAPPNPLYG